MRAVRRRDTSPELAVRRALHARGFRFRLDDGRLPGRPDIVLKRYRAAVFVQGCFWHRHEGCPKATTPDARREFWLEKFERNVKRDRAARDALMADGWRVAWVWECTLRSQRFEETIEAVDQWLLGAEQIFDSGKSFQI
jgi:DNA mismatch endonuclease (patch repair protein)